MSQGLLARLDLKAKGVFKAKGALRVRRARKANRGLKETRAIRASQGKPLLLRRPKGRNDRQRELRI